MTLTQFNSQFPLSSMVNNYIHFDLQYIFMYSASFMPDATNGAKSDGYNLVPQKNDEKAHGYWTKPSWHTVST